MTPQEFGGLLRLIFGISVVAFLWLIRNTLINLREQIRDSSDEIKKSLDDLGEKLDMIEDNTDTEGRERRRKLLDPEGLLR